MRRLILAAALALPACATLPKVDLCKNAPIRRQIYTTTIAAADAYALSGQSMPSAVVLGRQAAVTALAVLDANCPAVSS